MHIKLRVEILKEAWDTNFPLLCWTETASHPVCFSTLKKDEYQMGRGKRNMVDVRKHKSYNWALLAIGHTLQQ